MKTTRNKTILTSLLILCSSFFLSAQDNLPMLQDNNEWNVLYIDLLNLGDPTYINYTFQIFGDTIIQENSYFKLYIRNEEVASDWDYYGGLREEEGNNSVWFYRKFSSEEELLYDFSYTVGDTVTDFTLHMLVDSIKYQDIGGEIRKHIYFSYLDLSTLTEVWIEGVGSDKGIINSGNGITADFRTELFCMSETEELIYMNPTYNSCYFSSNNILESKGSLFKVFPNPAKDYFVIENSKNLTLESIKIFDLTGKVIKEFETIATHHNISEISSGVYLLKLNSENGETTMKFVIE